jgi:hypothetical protein
LFRFNRNIKTLCFGIEAKQWKQIVSKQTEKNVAYYAPDQTVSVGLLFVSVQSKHKNSLFRNKRFVLDSAETSFGCYESKLVSKDTLHARVNYIPQSGTMNLATGFPTGRKAKNLISLHTIKCTQMGSSNKNSHYGGS